MEKKNYQTSLEAVIKRPDTIFNYTEVEWREDGPYSVATGERVAVISTPRPLRTKKEQGKEDV